MRHVIRRVLAWIVPPLLLLAVVLGAPIILDFWGWQGAGGADANETDADAVTAPADPGPGDVVVLTPASVRNESAGNASSHAAPAEPARAADAAAAPPDAPAPTWSVAVLGKSASDAVPDAKEKRDGHAKGHGKHGKHGGPPDEDAWPGKKDEKPGKRGKGRS